MEMTGGGGGRRGEGGRADRGRGGLSRIELDTL